MKAIEQARAKGDNRRMRITLLKSDEGEKIFELSTRRLVDRKTRRITHTKSYFTVESFFVIKDLMDYFLDHPTIKNKVLLRELNTIEKSNVKYIVKTSL